VLPLLWAVIGVAITVILAFSAVLVDALTPPAGAVAAAFGSVVVVLGGFPYLALLALFVVATSLATRYGFEDKRRSNVHEGRRGERGISNVLAHIVVPTALVVGSVARPASFPGPVAAFLFTAALAFGTADTFASEFGVLSGRARSILNGRPVPPGTNGGISVVGELWALVGAGSTAVLGSALFLAFGTAILAPWLMLGGATLVGFVGCQIDSLLGETLENRGWLTKGSTNFLSMAATVALSLPLLAAAGSFP
jgi:uncharacterized protein (TIGR00297 family)